MIRKRVLALVMEGHDHRHRSHTRVVQSPSAIPQTLQQATVVGVFPGLEVTKSRGDEMVVTGRTHPLKVEVFAMVEHLL